MNCTYESFLYQFCESENYNISEMIIGFPVVCDTPYYYSLVEYLLVPDFFRVLCWNKCRDTDCTCTSPIFI